MSATFADVKKVLQKTADKAVKKTGEVYEYTKLSLSMTGLKNDVDQLYQQIGKSVYSHYTDEDFSIDDISALCEAVELKNEEIAKVKAKIQDLKNVTICRNCGASVSDDSLFCAKCGEKL